MTTASNWVNQALKELTSEFGSLDLEYKRKKHNTFHSIELRGVKNDEEFYSLCEIVFSLQKYFEKTYKKPKINIFFMVGENTEEEKIYDFESVNHWVYGAELQGGV